MPPRSHWYRSSFDRILHSMRGERREPITYSVGSGGAGQRGEHVMPYSVGSGGAGGAGRHDYHNLPAAPDVSFVNCSMHTAIDHAALERAIAANAPEVTFDIGEEIRSQMEAFARRGLYGLSPIESAREAMTSTVAVDQAPLTSERLLAAMDHLVAPPVPPRMHMSLTLGEGGALSYRPGENVHVNGQPFRIQAIVGNNTLQLEQILPTDDVPHDYLWRELNQHEQVTLPQNVPLAEINWTNVREEEFNDAVALAEYAEELTTPEPIKEVVQNMRREGVSGITYHHTGSRETCNPAPMDTDDDWLIYIPESEDAALQERRISAVATLMQYMGFTVDGADHYQHLIDTKFCSFRKGTLNILLTANAQFAARHKRATEFCKKLNVMDKEDRIALFRCFLYEETLV